MGDALQPLLWLLLLGWLIALLFLAGPLLRGMGLIKPNYQGTTIPVGFGLVVLLWSLPAYLILSLVNAFHTAVLSAYALVVVGMGLLGLADDLWGSRAHSGLKGHFRAFFREHRITTGFVKAVGGALLAFLVPLTILHHPWPTALLDGVIIALCANALNLLDLRPGRAGAIFIVLAGLIVCTALFSGAPPWLLFILVPTLLVYRLDAQAKVMMGDTGSNILGGTLGLALILDLPLPARLSVLGVLIVLHIVAERSSLSRIIEQTPWLRTVDSWTGKR